MATRSEQLFREAKRLIPGGVNSPVRAWGGVGGTPVFIERASGTTLVDVDGDEYLDFGGSWGPLILGHAPAEVVAAVQEAAGLGTSFGSPTEGEVELARELVSAVPSLETVRLVSSGTEATMSAIRVARAATGRDRVVKFAGCYHGHVDALLVQAGSGATTLGTPDSQGVPAAFTSLTAVCRYNDLASVREVFSELGDEIAAVIVEPVAGNMGVVPPEPGFLEGLREITRDAGALLVFDEVITGFRIARGGMQERSGVRPDLTCLGKIIGGGLPVGAFGGRRDLMDHLAPVGGVYQAGTLSGNPLSVAAGLVTLARLDRQAYDRLESLGARLEEGLRDAIREAGATAAIQRVGSMWTLFFGLEQVRSYDDVGKVDAARYGRFFHEMLRRGIYVPPSQFEAAFLSTAHREADVRQLVDAAREALAGS